MAGEDGDELAAVREIFKPFLTNNSVARITARKDKEHCASISNPWGDESILIQVPTEHAELAAALNGVYLPQQLAALWHRETKKLEFIWTALPMPPPWSDIPGRKFTFRFKEKSYPCRFEAASKELLVVAKHFAPGASTSTNFRNLVPFSFLASAEKTGANLPKFEALSFWIDNIDWDNDEILDLVNHLNFYLKYYDSISPVVLVYYPKEAESLKPQTRYPYESFPTHINAREIDDVMLILWDASRQGDNARQFLYCYRIIEYASVTHLESKARLDIKRILAAPHAVSELSAITNQVMDALQRSKLEDFQKCETLLREIVKPSLLWREIKENKSAFSGVTKFDGGFELGALIAPEATEATFETKGVDIFHKAIRDIRNALSHGKDSRSSGVITPTSRNFQKLRPWVSLVSIAAAEVMLYRDVL